jgi:hypothetical protein
MDKPLSQIRYKVDEISFLQKNCETTLAQENRFQVSLRQETLHKDIVTFEIFTNRLLTYPANTLTDKTYTAKVYFPNLPDWAVSMFRIVPIFSCFNTTNLVAMYEVNFSYNWEKIEDGHLCFLVFYLDSNSYYGTVYMDLEFHFLNLYTFQTI